MSKVDRGNGVEISVATNKSLRFSTLLGWLRGALFILLLVALSAPDGNADDRTLTVGGTGGALGAMSKLAEAYKLSNPATTIRILPSLGSSGGVRALAAGRIDIALTARPLKVGERQESLQVVHYARTAIVLATSTTNPATDITVQSLVKIVSGEMVEWPDGTPIGLVIRQEHDSETSALKSMSPLLPAALVKARNRPGVPVGHSVQNAADLIQSHKGGLGISTLATILSENRPLKGLSLDGVMPTDEAIRSGKYKYSESFYLVFNKQPHDGVTGFVKFIRSPAGADILRRTGHITVNN